MYIPTGLLLILLCTRSPVFCQSRHFFGILPLKILSSEIKFGTRLSENCFPTRLLCGIISLYFTTHAYTLFKGTWSPFVWKEIWEHWWREYDTDGEIVAGHHMSKTQLRITAIHSALKTEIKNKIIITLIMINVQHFFSDEY